MRGWVLAVCLGLTGCQSLNLEDTVMGPSFQPGNVFSLTSQLPNTLRRVAVMPITSIVPSTETELAAESLLPILVGEMTRCRAFEVVLVNPGQLKQWTGRVSLTAEEPLPPNFFKQVRDALGCQAVLFARLTQFRPYRPPAIGWNMKLVDCQDARIWWSIDEVFDAGNSAVANSARRYYQANIQASQRLPDSRTIFGSPSRYGQYTLSAALGTLPAR
jgi:hypothetical protein